MTMKSIASLEEQRNAQETNWAQANFMKCNALVAFVDILGFSGIGSTDVNPKIDSNFVALQQLLNCVEKTFSKIESKYSQCYIGNIQQVDENDFEEIPSVVKPDGGTEVRLFPERYLDVYVISDSIIVLCPLDGEGEANMLEVERAKILMLFEFCHELNQLMFENGLPLRGAIAYGDVYKPMQKARSELNGAVLLGRALIEAHEFGENINAAAIAVCPSAEGFLVRMGIGWSSVPGVTDDKIHLPLKTDRYYCVKTKIQSSDVEGAVNKCFSGCGKSAAGVRDKIENTVNVIKASRS